MIAVVLAAGLGSRLGEIKQDKPKGFLKLQGLDMSLIERSLEVLKTNGIKKVIIGVGYKAECYNKLVKQCLEANFEILVKTNLKFKEMGSAYTLHILRDLITEDFLLLESDLLYEERAIGELLSDKRECLVLLSGETNSGDEVFVKLREGEIEQISKELPKKESDGELVGISKISLQVFKDLDLLNYEHYESSFVGLNAKIIEDLIWCEIDDISHLKRAENIILPKILRKERM